MPWVLVALVLGALGIARGKDAACSCDAARTSQGFCEKHRIGWVAGLSIDAPLLFDALDLHGHDLGDTPACEVCRSGRFCGEHGRGMVRGQAYFSPLAYELARGTYQDPKTLTCKTCIENARTHGWCDACGVGRVGTVVLKDRAAHANVEHWLDILLAARLKSRECTLCAASMVSNGHCPRCKLSYDDGEATPDPPHDSSGVADRPRPD